MMLSSTLVFASKCSGADSWCKGNANNWHRLGAGIEMDVNSSCKSLFVSNRSWLVVWLTMSSSHLELFISRPTEDSTFLTMAVLLSTVYGSPPMHPSSRYQAFRSDLTSDVTPWIARANEPGRECPLVAHQWLSQGRTLHEREMFLKNNSPIWKDIFLGGVFELLGKLSRLMPLNAFLTSGFSKTFSLCGCAMKERVAWTSVSQPRGAPTPTREGSSNSRSLEI